MSNADACMSLRAEVSQALSALLHFDWRDGRSSAEAPSAGPHGQRLRAHGGSQGDHGRHARSARAFEDGRGEEEDAAEITAIMGLPAAAAPAAAAPDVIVDGPVFLRVVSGSIKAVRTVATQASE